MKPFIAIAMLLAAPPLALAESTPPKSPTMAERVIEAERRAAELLKNKAVRPSGYYTWQVLGGNANSSARIVDYHNGIITLQKKNGTLRTFRETVLGKADREYLTIWKKNTARIAPAQPAQKTLARRQPTQP